VGYASVVTRSVFVRGAGFAQLQLRVDNRPIAQG